MHVSKRAIVAAGLALVALASSCGEGFIVATFDLVIETPTSDASYDTDTSSVSLGGSIEFTLGIHDDLEVHWANQTTGASGSGTVNASQKTWNAGPVPLQLGANVIHVEFDADGGWDDDAQLTVNYAPSASPVPPYVDPITASSGTLVIPAGTQPPREGAGRTLDPTPSIESRERELE